MRTACSALVGVLGPLVRRSLVTAGFLLGLGLLGLVSAGSAEAEAEADRSPGLLGGVLGGVVEPLASVVEPVVGAVEPVTAPLLAPVTGPLEPVLEVVTPVTGPLLGDVDPVVTPVARAIGVEPSALGVDTAQARPAVPTPVDAEVGNFAPASAPEQPQAGDPAPVSVTSPVWTALPVLPATAAEVDPAARPDESWTPVNGPAAPDRGAVLLAGAVGTAASGSGGGGSPGQADLPGGQGLASPEGTRPVLTGRSTTLPWCYVFGRHHPS